MDPKVGLVIVTTNEEHNLRLFFSSVKRQSYKNLAFYLIDNNSIDNSVALAEELCPTIRVKRLKKNVGFAGANNLGAEMAIEDGCQMIFVLNNDTELHPSCVQELVQIFQTDERIGCAGPMVFKYDINKSRNVIQEYGGNIDFNNYVIKKNYVNKIFEDTGNIPEVMEVEFLMGGAFMIRADLVKKIGLFEVSYFIYGDEIDVFHRVVKSGHKIVVTKRALLWHNHHQLKRNIKRHYFERYYIMRNKYLYFLKFRLYDKLVFSLLKDACISLIIYKGYIRRGNLKIVYYHFKGILDGMRNKKGKSDHLFP